MSYYFFKVRYCDQSGTYQRIKVTDIVGKESKNTFRGHLKFTISDSEAYKIYDKQKALSVLAYMVKHTSKLKLKGMVLDDITLIRCIEDSAYEHVMVVEVYNET